MFVDYYSVLDISYDSTLSDIKSAYRKQAFNWHPDRNKDDTTEMMQLINEAKFILLDEKARERYDIEYLKFRRTRQSDQLQNQKEEEYSSYGRETSSGPKFTEYEIQDDILAQWIINARRRAKEIIEETVLLSKVGGSAAVKELKEGLGCWLKGIIIVAILVVITFIIKSQL